MSFFLYHAKRTKNRQTPIYLRIRYNHDQVTLATDYVVSASNWDKKSKKVKGTCAEVKSINGDLKALKVKIRSTVNHLMIIGRPFTVFNIKEQVSGASKKAYTLKDAFDTYLSMVKSLIGKDYSPITLLKYQQTYNRILEFAKYKYKYNRTTFYLYDLDDMFMSEFERYLKPKFIIII